MKWEYKVVNINAHFSTGGRSEWKLQRICDDYGSYGWELVNFQSWDAATKFMLIFKRPQE